MIFTYFRQPIFTAFVLASGIIWTASYLRHAHDCYDIPIPGGVKTCIILTGLDSYYVKDYAKAIHFADIAHTFDPADSRSAFYRCEWRSKAQRNEETIIACKHLLSLKNISSDIELPARYYLINSYRALGVKNKIVEECRIIHKKFNVTAQTFLSANGIKNLCVI